MNLFYLRLGVEILKQRIRELFSIEPYRILKPQETSKEHIPEEAASERIETHIPKESHLPELVTA